MAGRIEQVIKRTGAVVPFDPVRIEVAIYKAAASLGGRDRALANRLAAKVVEQLERSGSLIPTVEEVQDAVERVLIHEGHAATAKAYILYRFQRHQMRKGELGIRQDGRMETIPWKLIWKTLVWNQDHDCDTLEGLGRWVRTNRIGELYRECDQEYERQLDDAAQEMLGRTGTRLLIVAGPSSSGKTTTTTKLAQRLEAAGARLVTINLDNYFRDLALHPRDEHGDYDYETPEAMDLPLINRHFERLVKGERVMMPVYDFHQGRQFLDQVPLQLGANDILLVDTLHGLYGPLTQAVDDAVKFKVYVETFSQVRPAGESFVKWTDLRLMRRMVRDARFRNHSPKLTLGHWHYVRRGEMKHIIPYLPTVDFVVNGSLAYELPVLKRHVWPCLDDILRHYREAGVREDAVTRGERIRALLEQVEAVSEEQEALIGPESLMREFIGGSRLKY